MKISFQAESLLNNVRFVTVTFACVFALTGINSLLGEDRPNILWIVVDAHSHVKSVISCDHLGVVI